MMTRTAYLNGNWVAADQLSIGVDDLGLTMGVTVVERLRTFRGSVFRLEMHLERMRRSLEIIGLDVDAIIAECRELIPECVARNRGQLDDEDDWGVVAFVTPGPAAGGSPTVCVEAFPLAFHTWVDHYTQGVRLQLSDVRQVPANCWPPQLKCRSRIHYYLADRQARRQDPAARALLLDQDGYVGETTTANILLYRKDEGLLTPPVEHVLPGVSQAVVRELAGQLAIPVHERRIRPEELLTADEVMLASTSVCLLPVVSCDGQPLAGGQPGDVYRRLLSAWSTAVGVDIAEQARRYAPCRTA